MPREGGENQMSAVSATMEEVELARRARVVRELLEWPPTLTVWWSAGGRVRAFELTAHGREEWVVEATEALADEVAGDGARGRRAAERLKRELREGTELHRVGLRGVQRALVSELARGHTVGELCVRGGFVSGGQPDATGLMRAAGLRDRPV